MEKDAKRQIKAKKMLKDGFNVPLTGRVFFEAYELDLTAL